MSGQPTQPYGLGQRNAGSSLKLEVTSLDDEDVLFEPDTMRYRIDNLSAVRVVLDWTIVANPASIQIIRIPAGLNQIIFTGNDQELIQVTVEITQESENGDEVQQQLFLYDLINISQSRSIFGP